jgi:hypothetical protein
VRGDTRFGEHDEMRWLEVAPYRPTKAIYTTTEEQKFNDTRLVAAGYALTRSPDAADLSMAAMTSWRSTATAKSGTVCVPLSMSAANAA